MAVNLMAKFAAPNGRVYFIGSSKSKGRAVKYGVCYMAADGKICACSNKPLRKTIYEAQADLYDMAHRAGWAEVEG